jgi:hypothetical protein
MVVIFVLDEGDDNARIELLVLDVELLKRSKGRVRVRARKVSPATSFHFR